MRQISKQTEERPPLIELTLAIPRYPCRNFADRLRQYRTLESLPFRNLRSLSVQKWALRVVSPAFVTSRVLPQILRATRGHLVLVVSQV
jgi:hypothetical protein